MLEGGLGGTNDFCYDGTMVLKTTQHCDSLEPFYDRFVPSESRPEHFYTVRIAYPGDPPSEWTCDCPSYTYRGHCKHIDLLATMRVCSWDSETGPEEQTEEQEHNHVCPRCGNMTTVVVESD